MLAFYYTWYSADLWGLGKTSDAAAQPYNSTDPAAIARHVDQARASGIDGFVASWYGPDGEANNQTQSNFLQLLDIAAARGFRAAIDFETYSPFFADAGDVASALQYAIGTLGQHPAYLRYAGKPVIFFWANNRFSPEEWAAIRAQADPNHDSIWIAEGVTGQWLSVFDGLHLYNVAWSADFAATAARFAKLTRDAGKVWAATAMPGWDDTRVPGRAGAYAKDRAGGQFYRDSFAGAAASNPDLLIITSFNEWVEGSQIEPSTSYGDLYLNLTRELAGAYKQGSQGAEGQGSAGAEEQGSSGAGVQGSAGAVAESIVETATAAPTEIVPVDTPTVAADTPVPTIAGLTDTPAPPSLTPPPFDTPVAFVVAEVLDATATARPSDAPTPQLTPTTLVMTLEPAALARESVADVSEVPVSGLAALLAGATILGGGIALAGFILRRR